MYELDFSVVSNYYELILRGIIITLHICSISLLLAYLFASILFFGRWGQNKIINKIVTMFVSFIRNTPLLIQLYIYYKGFPQLGITMSAETCGIIALSIYTGVYISEVMRAGANNIQNQQKNAALALGLSDFQTFIYVVYPQVVRSVILPIGSQFINLIKNSTLVSFIAVTDIFYAVSQGMSDYFRVVEFMLVGVILYGSLCLVISLFTNFLELKFKIKMSEEV